jgi:hypothetical protein
MSPSLARAVRGVALPLASCLAVLGTNGPWSAAAEDQPQQAGPVLEDYAPLARPFAMPGFKEQEFNGALFVGHGETRFSTSVSLVTEANKVVHENMVPNIRSFGPIASDGSYYEIRISSDDRVLHQARLDALQETIDHPESWSAEEVTTAKAQLPVLQKQYDAIQAQKQDIVMRYARVSDEELVGSVTALDDGTTIYMDASAPFAEPSTYEVTGPGSLAGTTRGLTDEDQTAHFRVDADHAADGARSYATLKDMINAMGGKNATDGTAAAALHYELDAGDTLTFTARMGDETLPPARRTPEEVTELLDRARTRVDKVSVSGSGPLGEIIDAMRDAMALNANYDEKFNRSFMMWGLGGGGDDIFKGWDSAWDAITAAQLDPALALDHIRDFYAQGGPRYDQLHAGPMHAYAAWRVYQRTGERSILELVYPVMTAYIARMPEFDVNGDGLLESPWVADRPGGRGNHLGLDDSPQFFGYEQIPRDGGTDTRDHTDLTDVPLNSYYGLFAHVLAQMADELGKPVESKQYEDLHAQLAKQMDARLWHDERGLYLNRYLDGRWEHTTTPTVFYPLFGGLASPEHAQRLVGEHLENPEEFGGEYVLPSVARNDPAFCSSGNHHPESQHFTYFQEHMEEDACEEWKGAVWPPMNATVYDGLKRYGFDEEAARLATKSTELWRSTYEELGWFPEYWDAEPGQLINGAATDTTWRTYSWSNLMPLMSSTELFSDDAWGDVNGFRFGTLGLPGRNAVHDVPWRGRTYSVVADANSTNLSRDGRVLFTASGGRVVVRDFVLTSTGATFEVTADQKVTITVRPEAAPAGRVAVPAGTTKVRL